MSDKAKRNIFLSDLRAFLDKHSAVLRVERRFDSAGCVHWLEVDIDGCDDLTLGSYFDSQSMEGGDDEVRDE